VPVRSGPDCWPERVRGAGTIAAMTTARNRRGALCMVIFRLEWFEAEVRYALVRIRP
jgi:hypothetical protein